MRIRVRIAGVTSGDGGGRATSTAIAGSVLTDAWGKEDFGLGFAGAVLGRAVVVVVVVVEEDVVECCEVDEGRGGRSEAFTAADVRFRSSDTEGLVTVGEGRSI